MCVYILFVIFVIYQFVNYIYNHFTHNFTHIYISIILHGLHEDGVTIFRIKNKDYNKEIKIRFV